MSGIMDNFRIEGRTAIVTGASSGLGVGFARALCEAGGQVVLAARRVDRLEQVAADLMSAGFRCITVEADVANAEDCTRVVACAVEEFGSVDVLVNNAGIGTAVPATREDPADFKRVLDVNLSGSYFMAQACGRVMPPGSSIINVSSIIGLTSAGLPQAAYASSKAGLFGMTRDLAAQWSQRKGIRVNAVAPGFFVTEMSDAYAPGYLDAQLERTLMGRAGELDELSTTVIWLASPASGYVTGQTITVDGGRTVT